MLDSILAITGPTSGLGMSAVKSLVNEFDRILLLCRNIEKGKHLKNELLELNTQLYIDIIHCDLSDLSSVAAASKTIIEQYNQIDCLINNAGIISLTKKESVDGYDLMMATNYLGPFLLTHYLLPLVMNSRRKQVVVVSSGAYKFAPMKEPFFQPTHFNPVTAYGKSKLGTLYLTQELHEKYSQQGIKTTAVHPGVVSTNIGKDNVSEKLGDLFFSVLDFMFITVEEGAASIVSAVTSPEKYAGFYSHEGEIIPVKKHGDDFRMRRKFIDATLEELGLNHL